MPYSVRKKNGTWEDVTFRQRTNHHDETQYTVFLGKEQVGKVMSSRFGWTALSYNYGREVKHLNMIPGFQSRWKAMEYILEHQGYPRTGSDGTTERIIREIEMKKAHSIVMESELWS